MTYREWMTANGVDHAHCPDDCEHPQPFVEDGTLWCGRCWFVHKTRSKMIPCTPENCA